MRAEPLKFNEIPQSILHFSILNTVIPYFLASQYETSRISSIPMAPDWTPGHCRLLHSGPHDRQILPDGML
jgi:hypothetical protein